MKSRIGHDPESVVRDIKCKARRKFFVEAKIRIILEGLKGETSIAELCRREGIIANLYYRWSKDFLEAGKKRLRGDSVRELTHQVNMTGIYSTTFLSAESAAVRS